MCLNCQVLILFVVDWLEKKNWSPNSQPPIWNISHVTLLFSCNKQLGTNQRPLRGQGQGIWPGFNCDKNRKLHEACKQQWLHCRCCNSSSFIRTWLVLHSMQRCRCWFGWWNSDWTNITVLVQLQHGQLTEEIWIFFVEYNILNNLTWTCEL